VVGGGNEFDGGGVVVVWVVLVVWVGCGWGVGGVGGVDGGRAQWEGNTEGSASIQCSPLHFSCLVPNMLSTTCACSDSSINITQDTPWCWQWMEAAHMKMACKSANQCLGGTQKEHGALATHVHSSSSIGIAGVTQLWPVQQSSCTWCSSSGTHIGPAHRKVPSGGVSTTSCSWMIIPCKTNKVAHQLRTFLMLLCIQTLIVGHKSHHITQ
jgi:hypothetical protein